MKNMSNIFDKNKPKPHDLPMKLSEMGRRVRERREALGLSQERLAKLSGLSRATVNQLENGTLVELGVTRLMALLDLMGLELSAGVRSTRPQRGLRMASRTASVSYRKTLQPDALAHALASGELPSDLRPHLATLLDEAPLPIIVSAVEEAALQEQVPPKLMWRHLYRWAQSLHSPRTAWN